MNGKVQACVLQPLAVVHSVAARSCACTVQELLHSCRQRRCRARLCNRMSRHGPVHSPVLHCLHAECWSVLLVFRWASVQLFAQVGAGGTGHHIKKGRGP